jgi:hypothetical protein
LATGEPLVTTIRAARGTPADEGLASIASVAHIGKQNDRRRQLTALIF